MPRTLFWFEIPIGLNWRHELPIARDENGNPVDDWSGWVASLRIRDQDGNVIADLNSEAGPFDGTITLAPGGLITLFLASAVTATFIPTATYGGGKTRARLFGDVILAKGFGTSILAARMSGVVTTTTAIGA